MFKYLLKRGLTTIALFACLNSLAASPTVEQEAMPVADNIHPKAKLVIGSERLLDNIILVNPLLRPLGQLTQAQVSIENLSETRYTLEYKFDWQDSNGFNVDNMNTWHRFTLTPRESKYFKSIGKTPDATNIVFTVRLPDDAFIEYSKQYNQQQQNQNINPEEEISNENEEF